VGGIAGYNVGTINKCSAVGGNIYLNLGNIRRGGLIAGESKGTISNCFATGSVHITQPDKYCNTKEKGAGLAGGIVANNYGTIKNLTIENAVVSLTSVYDIYAFVGILAGQNEGYIGNCTIYGNLSVIVLNGTEANYSLVVGGIAGFNEAVISDSTYIGEVGVAVVNKNYNSVTSKICTHTRYHVGRWYEDGLVINCTSKSK
jgi:hypothetical protein